MKVFLWWSLADWQLWRLLCSVRPWLGLEDGADGGIFCLSWGFQVKHGVFYSDYGGSVSPGMDRCNQLRWWQVGWGTGRAARYRIWELVMVASGLRTRRGVWGFSYDSVDAMVVSGWGFARAAITWWQAACSSSCRPLMKREWRWGSSVQLFILSCSIKGEEEDAREEKMVMVMMMNSSLWNDEDDDGRGGYVFFFPFWRGGLMKGRREWWGWIVLRAFFPWFFVPFLCVYGVVLLWK